jgi:uncharacterized protein YqgV (UPF0045/DUF77 family)
MGHNTNILRAVANTGKIFMKAQLLDPLLGGEGGLRKPKGIYDNISIYTATTHASAMTHILKNNLKNLPNIKDKAQQIKTEKFRSITEHTNEFLKSLKNKKNAIAEDLFEDIEEEPEKKPEEEFNDGISDFSISIIDGSEENHLEIDKMNIDIDNLINRIKLVFENKIDTILPEEPAEIKNFIGDVTNQIHLISENYTQNLLTFSDINKRIKFQAKDYYERYKEAKKKLRRDRRDLKNKNKLVEYENRMNVDENYKIQAQLEEVKNELNFFKNKLGIRDPGINRDEDLLLMVDILNSVKINGDFDITSGLDDTQKASLGEIIEKYSEQIKSEPRNSQILVEEDEINDEEIIKNIEEIVNENFKNKKIINIKIDQDSEDTFKFNDKAAVVYIENDVLKIKEKGFENFEEWLIQNFGTHLGEKSYTKKVTPINPKNAVQALLDKKLAEKKAMLGNIVPSTRTKTPLSGKKI